jgi:hypothetical protein
LPSGELTRAASEERAGERFDVGLAPKSRGGASFRDGRGPRFLGSIVAETLCSRPIEPIPVVCDSLIETGVGLSTIRAKTSANGDSPFYIIGRRPWRANLAR